MTDVDRMEQLQDALDQMGNTHSLEDIVGMIDTGAMQSFVNDDTWMVTQVVDFPRKRVLEIFLVVGELFATEKLFNEVDAFARAHGCDLIRAFGRHGWQKWAKPRGWKNGAHVYYKEA